MEHIFETLVHFFRDDGWGGTPAKDAPVLHLQFQGEHGRWDCYAQAREEQQQIAFYSVCAVNAPEDRRAAMAEFITRANFGLVPGNFEMDWGSGEIRFTTRLEVDDAPPGEGLLRRMVYANVLLMDAYLPGIMKVLYGHVPPAEAIAAIEDAEPPPPAPGA